MTVSFGNRGARSRGTVALALLFFAAAPVAAPGARAQEPTIDSPYRWLQKGLRAGLVAGYLNADRGSLEFGPGSTEVFGGRFRARVSSPLSIEVGALTGFSDRLVIDPRLETGPAPVDTVSSRWVAAHFGVQLALTGGRAWNGVQPYILLDAGLLIGVDEEQSEVFSEPELADLRYELGTAPTFIGGVGAEFRPSDRIGVGLEFRDYLLRLKAPDGFFRSEVLQTIEEAGVTAPSDTQWPHNLELSIGLWYYL